MFVQCMSLAIDECRKRLVRNFCNLLRKIRSRKADRRQTEQAPLAYEPSRYYCQAQFPTSSSAIDACVRPTTPAPPPPPSVGALPPVERASPNHMNSNRVMQPARPCALCTAIFAHRRRGSDLKQESISSSTGRRRSQKLIRRKLHLLTCCCPLSVFASVSNLRRSSPFNGPRPMLLLKTTTKLSNGIIM